MVIWFICICERILQTVKRDSIFARRGRKRSDFEAATSGRLQGALTKIFDTLLDRCWPNWPPILRGRRCKNWPRRVESDSSGLARSKLSRVNTSLLNSITLVPKRTIYSDFGKFGPFFSSVDSPLPSDASKELNSRYTEMTMRWLTTSTTNQRIINRSNFLIFPDNETASEGHRVYSVFHARLQEALKIIIVF